jgi:hypothetical protein
MTTNSASGPTKRKSFYGGICVDCGKPYSPNEWIVRIRVGKFAHLICPVEK